MDLQLKGKTAFISGSTAGIGFETARVLLQEGAQVLINGRDEERTSKAIQKLKKALPAASVGGLVADFSRPEQVQELMKKLEKVDILINNIGVYASQSFYETSDEEWHRQIEVNIMSGVRLSRYFLPMMMQTNWGRIIFISSECASLVPADLIAYSTTKAAILALSRGLAQLTRGKDVTVNTIIPGSTFTEGAEQFLENLAKEENKSIEQAEVDFFREARTSSIIQRFIAVEEIAHTIAYFASPLSAGTNGAAIKIDGGSMGGIF